MVFPGFAKLNTIYKKHEYKKLFVCRWLWGDCKGDEEIDAGTNIGGVFFQTCNVFEQFSTIRIKIKHNLGKYMMFFLLLS